MLTVCTTHLGFAIETYPTWRHESRCPSEERISNETFWPERHIDNNTRSVNRVEQKELPKDEIAEQARLWRKRIEIGRKHNDRLEIEATEKETNLGNLTINK